MILSTYQTNRASFPAAQLAKYRGQWIAFAADGTHIVASGETFEQADRQVQAAGIDPNVVFFERVPSAEDDICLGGAGLQ